jgi:hypothetical protein
MTYEATDNMLSALNQNSNANSVGLNVLGTKAVLMETLTD